jgi:hypothetical protein
MVFRRCSHLPVVHVLMLLPGGNGAESGECKLNLLPSEPINGSAIEVRQR